MDDRRTFSVLASFRLDGDCAVVTGGGKGLGRIACLALAEAGAKVAVLDLDETTAQQTVGEIAEAGGEARSWVCDVTDEASMDAVFAEIGETWGKLDFVVHAIAYSDKDELKGQYVDTSRANFQRSLDISCFSFTEACR